MNTTTPVHLGRRNVLAGGAALAAAAALWPKHLFAQDTKVIRMGGAGPLSGPAAYWGHSTAQGFIDGAAEVNAAGGLLLGGVPHRIEVVNYDSKGETADARAATLRLIEQDGCQYVFTNGAASTVGVLQVSEPAGAISLAGCWGYLELFGSQYPLHFRPEMSDYEQGYAYIPFMLEKYGKDALKTAAFIGPNDKDGTDCHFSYQRLMDYYGIKQTTALYYNWEDTDFYPIVARCIAAKPAFIVTSPSPPGITASIIKAARELGYRGPISSPAASETKTILEVAGEHADGVILPVTNVTPSTEVQKAIEQRFTRRFGSFNALAGNYSWWFWSLKAAWEMAGTATDTRAVAEALGQVELADSYVGRARFAGEKAFGAARQGVYDCFTTTIDKGIAKVEDVRFPALPDNY